MEKIVFRPDVPVQVSLQCVEGKLVKSRFNGKEMMFATTDDRAFYLRPEDGASIQNRLRDLGARPGDPLVITKEVAYEGGKMTQRWTVYPASTNVGEQSDGTFIVPAQPGARPAAKDSPYEHSGTSLLLRERTNMLVDVYASCLGYAKQQYGDQVKAGEVLTLLLTAAGGKRC